MSDVNQEIQSILELKAQASSIQINAQNVSEQTNEKMKELRERIKRGETTGDRIKDLVIARYGFMNEEIETVYRDLEARIGQHVGEFVLMITKEENVHGCTGFGYKPKNLDYVLDEHLYLGVLKDGLLVLDPANGKCELPTGNSVRCRQYAWSKNMELVEGNLTSHWLNDDFGLSLNKPLKRRNPMACLRAEADLKLEIKIGDVEVRAWFERRREHYLVDFKNASQLLGRQIDESPQLTAELQQQRETVAKQLAELIKERDQLKEKIARIFGAIKNGVYSSDGMSVTVCETEEDARAISMGPRQKLKEVEDEIKRQLKIALEFDMIDVRLLTIQ
jgi:seryl-tRNA synthetase